MKALTEICISKVASNFSIFKSNLHLLPNDLREQIELETFASKYEIFNGKIYPRVPSPGACGDWGCYKL